MAASEAVAEVRQLFQLTEFEEVLGLQKAVWGFDDVELLPGRFLIVVNSVGGQVFGAYMSGRMVGFCDALPGIKPDGRPYLHSDMLGILPEYRNIGIGRRLKLLQREEALSRGIELIEWTFDPLELKNAYFNIERLGAIVRRYHPNQYGITGSPLHGSLPTDRLYAEWWLNRPAPAPVEPAARIAYPNDIARLRTADPALARSIQQEKAAEFRDAFQRGLAVTGFERGVTESAYLLEPWQ